MLFQLKRFALVMTVSLCASHAHAQSLPDVYKSFELVQSLGALVFALLLFGGLLAVCKDHTWGMNFWRERVRDDLNALRYLVDEIEMPKDD